VLLHLRGVTREDLRPLRGEPTDADPDPAAFRDEDVEVAADAALRAARLLAEVRLDGSDAPPAAPAAR
jgi:hypothetical protein